MTIQSGFVAPQALDFAIALYCAWGCFRLFVVGEQTFCLIGTWSSQDAMVAARSAMIKTLDSFRSVLEDQGQGRGVTDAVSGAVVLAL